MTPHELKRIGTALAGKQWHGSIAAIGQVDPRTLYRFLHEGGSLPDSFDDLIYREIVCRIQLLRKLRNNLNS